MSRSNPMHHGAPLVRQPRQAHCPRPVAAAADHRLLSAAPDLLAALQVLDTMARRTAQTFPNAPGVGDWRQASLIARAAIARATGVTA